MRYDVVIIGSGLGGLECAYILAKQGKKVCVLEKNGAIGGCLQSFKKGAHTFDTGFHYIGALGKGEVLGRLFNYLNLSDLPWVELDRNGFDEIILRDKNYLLANGYSEFAERMSSYFPQSRNEIKSYTALLQRVGDNIMKPVEQPDSGANELFAANAYDYLHKTLQNTDLQGVISGNSLKMELNKETLPLYTFAQINSSFIQSAWRLRGGGSLIAAKLQKNIEAMGGAVYTNMPAIKIGEENGKAIYVETPHERFETQRVISDLSPALTLELLKETPSVRPIFRKRVSGLAQTFGAFTVNLALKQGMIPYLNRNIYYYAPDVESPWDMVQYAESEDVKGVLISFQVPPEGEKHTANVDIITPMSFNRVAQWADTQVCRRGEAYLEFKGRMAEKCIALAENCIPNLRSAIESVTTSTPLTYMNYTGAVNGTAYGIRKDCNNLFQTLLTPKTPLQNLFFTGQNLNLHGVLGVTMTSLLTCRELLK